MLATECDAICPLTGSRDVSLVESLAASKLIDDWQQTYGIDIEGELAGCDRIDLYESPTTSLRFFLPATLAGSDRLYEQLHAFDWYYAPHRWEHQRALRDLTGTRRVLEIGCGEGAFVARLIAAGIEAEGLEINSRAAQLAGAQGLPVRVANLHEVAAQLPGAYDAVCSFQVLEHVPDPRAFLESALQLLRPGGKLLLAVPNQQSFLRHQWNLLNLPPHHMTQWSAATFRALAGLLDLRLAAVACEPLAPCHVPGYVATYADRWREQPPWWWNGATQWAWKRALKLGLRRFCVGQCLYVALETRL